MSRVIGHVPRLTELVESSDLAPATVRRLTALALMQAHICTGALCDVVIPTLSPSNRVFALSIARRISRKEILTDDFLRDLEAFNASLGVEIDSGTRIVWHRDEHHIRGGYEWTLLDPGISALAESKAELEMLRDIVLAALCGAHALGEVEMSFTE